MVEGVDSWANYKFHLMVFIFFAVLPLFRGYQEKNEEGMSHIFYNTANTTVFPCRKTIRRLKHSKNFLSDKNVGFVVHRLCLKIGQV